MTQLTLSNKTSNTTKTTLFFVNYKRKFNLFDYEKSLMLMNATKKRAKLLKKIHDNIIRMQNKSSTYIN